MCTSIKLNRSGIGGNIGCHLINHLRYADDLCLISLSSASMQKLYVSNLSILNFIHHIYFNRLEIPRVDQCKHLGIMISIKNCDMDIKRQMKKFYANINILLRTFSIVPLM